MAGYEVLFGIRNRIRTLCRRPGRSRAHNCGSFLDGDTRNQGRLPATTVSRNLSDSSTKKLNKIIQAANKEHHYSTEELDFELHDTQREQRDPHECQLNEPSHSGRVHALAIWRYGRVSSDLRIILVLVTRERARKHTALYNIGFSEVEAFFRQKIEL